MSSIGSVRDGLQDLRKKSLTQERAIDRNGEFSHWRMSDATKVTLLERGLGFAILPVFAFWALILAILSVSIGASLVCFHLLSRLFR
jgi:hypothetical protein